MMRGWPLLLVLVSCGGPAVVRQAEPDGMLLEEAARQQGLVVDPTRLSLAGAWARDSDRVCIVPGQGSAFRIGVRVDYGEGQSCAAQGTATRSGNSVQLTFGSCAFAASFEGDRLTFPATVPEECDRLCAGRASLAAVAVDRLSTSVSEAATLRASNGTSLCSS